MFLCNSVTLCDSAKKGEERCYSVICTTQFQRDKALAHISARETLVEDTGLWMIISQTEEVTRAGIDSYLPGGFAVESLYR